MKSVVTTLAATAAVCLASTVSAAVVGITGLTTTNGDPAEVVAANTLVTSFTTGLTTHTNLTGATVTNRGAVNTSQPIFPVGGTSSSALSVTGDLDVSAGLANVTQPGGSLDFLFGDTFNALGAVGLGNDFFILELGTTSAGDDTVTLQALDIAGNVIAGSSFTINPGDFGDTGKDIRFALGGSTSESGASPRAIAGVGFDVTDFGVPAATTGVAGFRLSSGGLDPLVIGANLNAIPEPASLALLTLGSLTLLTRRRA